MSTVLEKIKSRGHWRIVIRPEQYVENRISELGECKDIIRDNTVLFRGWDYPHWNTHQNPLAGLNYVEQEVDWEDHIELWRYYQSGQFIHYQALWIDWADAITRYKVRYGTEPGQWLSFLDLLYTLTEVYEFASRLGSKQLLGESCVLEIDLIGANSRTITSLDPSRHLRGAYTCHLDNLHYPLSLPTQDLIAQSPKLALQHTIWVLQRFNWDHPSETMLAEDQKNLIEKQL